MNTMKAIKIAALLIVPVLVLTIGLYFVYPYINSEKYEEISRKYGYEKVTSETAAPDSLKKMDKPTPEQSFRDSLQRENRRLSLLEDSLRLANDSLQTQLEQFSGAAVQDSLKMAQLRAAEDQEANIAEKIKSLLNLDEEQLAPIVNELSDRQLMRLYEGSGTMQRRKLLRSLEPKRAAKLMTELLS